MVFGAIGLLRMASGAVTSGAMAYGKEAGLNMASRVGATEGTGDEKKLKEGIINGPKGVLTRLKDGAKMASKMTGVTASISAMLKQSQIFTGVVGSIFQIIGALIDILLIPLVPIFMPIVQSLAVLTKYALAANEKGFMPALAFVPVIGPYLLLAHSASIAADYVSDYLKNLDWGKIGKDMWENVKNASGLQWLFGTDNIIHKMGRKIADVALWLETGLEAVFKDSLAFLLEIPIQLVTLVNSLIGVLNQARWPSAGILGGGGLIFGSGLPAPIELEKFLRKEQKDLRAGAEASRMRYADRFPLAGSTEVLTRETVTDAFGNDRRVLDADSLRRGVEAIYQNSTKALVYHVEREQEMLDMDFSYS